MIVRILGEGQFDIPDGTLDELNSLDDDVTSAIDSGDEKAFKEALDKLLGAVRDKGSPTPDDFLGPSELVLPGADATVQEVEELLTDEGLIPD